MARRRRAEKRKVTPDPKYHNIELSQFINKVMLNGKKTVAQRIVYEALGQGLTGGAPSADRGIRPGDTECYADGRGSVSQGGRSDLPGADRGQARTSIGAVHAMDNPGGARQARQADGGQAVSRACGGGPRSGHRREASRRPLPDGRGEQSICPLSLVIRRL